MSRTFTIDEARTLLPVMGALLGRARGAAVRAGLLDEEMQELSQKIFLAGGLYVDVPAAARRRAEREKAMQEARTTIEEITEIGVQVAENDDGGLEFPCIAEGRTVLLVWELGEQEIERWREAEDGSPVRPLSDGPFGLARERLQ